jgi:hypothetical protein
MNDIINFLIDNGIGYTINSGMGGYITLSFKLHDFMFDFYIDKDTTIDEFKKTINENFKSKLINQKKFYSGMVCALENSINNYNGVF